MLLQKSDYIKHCFTESEVSFACILLKFIARKARRCFQKAYDLDPMKDETGCALVDILMDLGEEASSYFIGSYFIIL